MENNFISIKVIIDRIMLRPLYKGLQFDSAIIWAIDVLNLIEMPEFLIPKVARVHVEEYKGTLPHDCISVKKIDIVKEGGNEYRMSTKTSSDPFIVGYKNRIDLKTEEVFDGYSIVGDYIHCGFETGILEIAYQALRLDTDSYIMIPDNTFVILAVQNYIQLQHLKILLEMGEVPQYLVEMQFTDYAFAVGRVKAQRQFENLDKVESIRNSLGRLAPINNNHSTDYRFGTLRENRYI